MICMSEDEAFDAGVPFDPEVPRSMQEYRDAAWLAVCGIADLAAASVGKPVDLVAFQRHAIAAAHALKSLSDRIGIPPSDLPACMARLGPRSEGVICQPVKP